MLLPGELKPESFFSLRLSEKSSKNQKINLVDRPASQAASNVPYKEEAGHPGALVQVQLDGLPWLRLADHLRKGDAGEGDPAANHRLAPGDGQGAQDLRGETRTPPTWAVKKDFEVMVPWEARSDWP